MVAAGCYYMWADMLEWATDDWEGSCKVNGTVQSDHVM